MRISAFQKKNNLGDRITQSNGINRASEEDNVTITSQRSGGDAENVTTSLEEDKVPFESGDTVNKSRIEAENVTICAPEEDKVPFESSETVNKSRVETESVTICAPEEDNVTITSQRSEGDAENVTTSLEGDKVPFESGETVNESRVETESVTICAPGEDKVPYAESIKSVLQSEAVIQATSEYSEGRSDSNEVTTRRWALLFISMLND